MKQKNPCFSAKCLRALGEHYVYGLTDPRTGKLFYIGKGTGNRVFDHEYESLKNPASEKLKLATIREIKEAGLAVGKIILNCNLTENEAYAAEAALINAFNYVEHTGLTNDVAGHHSKKAYSVEEFEQMFGAEELTEADIPHHLFVIKVNRLYHFGMTEQETYDVVRGCWKTKNPYKMNRLNKVEYVLGVYHSLIVAVYKPTVWAYVKDAPDGVPPRDLGKPELGDRVYFRDADFESGAEPDEAKKFYLHKSVEHVRNLDKVQGCTYYDP